MTSQQNRGYLRDLRTATEKQLGGLDASQAARQLMLQEHIRLYDALLKDNGPGDDAEYRQALRGLLAVPGTWQVENTKSEPAIQGEAGRLLEVLEKRMGHRAK